MPNCFGWSKFGFSFSLFFSLEGYHVRAFLESVSTAYETYASPSKEYRFII